LGTLFFYEEAERKHIPFFTTEGKIPVLFLPPACADRRTNTNGK